MISYIDTIQVLLSIATIIAIALLTSYLKMFVEKDISTLRRTIFFVALPAMIFYRIALRELIYETWQPFLHSICTQLTINLMFLLVVLIIPFKNRFTKFIECVFSCSYSSFFYGYEIIYVLYGENYIFIPVISSIVHFFLMNPINALIISFLNKDEEKTDSTNSQNSNVSDLDELDDGIEDKKGLPIHPVETPSNSSSNENNNAEQNSEAGSYSANSDAENPQKKNEKNSENDESENEIESLVTQPEFEKNPENVYDYPDELEEGSTDPKLVIEDEFDVHDSRTKAVLKRVLSPLNIAAILGIIWSIWHCHVPILIEKTANFLELAVPCTGFACIGFSLWNLPLTGCNWIEVSILLFVHYIILPAIAFLWSWVFKFDDIMATICLLINIAPVSFSGFTMAKKSGLKMKSVSDTFLWSNVIFIPILMLWILAINKIHLFGN